MQKDIERYYFFTHSVYRVDYPNAEKFREIIVPKFKEFEKNNPIEDNSYSLGGYTSFFHDPQLFSTFKEDMEDFISWANESVNKVHNAANIPLPVKPYGSWFNINRKNSFHSMHNHVPHIWSCVYYVQADYDDDARLTFFGPNNESRWPYINLPSYNEDTSQEQQVRSSTGSMWIFPSYLPHRVNQQRADNERISIAFNYDYEDRNGI